MRCLVDQLVVHEIAGERVEQFRMGRQRAANAEIARRIDQALAEQVVPNAVDPHARGERVVATRDVVRKFKPTAAVLERFGFVVGSERGEETALGVRAAVAGASTEEHIGIVWFG